MKTALITGVTGQDGSYLAELLLARGYRVVGVTRDSAAVSGRLEGVRSRILTIEVDSRDARSIAGALEEHMPDEIYNLGGMASSSQLFDGADALLQANGLAAVRWMDAIRLVKPDTRFCQASSSEMFGNSQESSQNESTCFRPRNPYGVAKLYAHHMVGIYRATYGLHVGSSILFNHESPRRGLDFVTRKITRGVAEIVLGSQSQLRLGSLDSRRDWGYAKDYVEGMWMMLQQDSPDDYVLATGKTHSVREFCDIAFRHVGLNYEKFVVTDPEISRRSESAVLCGDASKAREKMGWQNTVTFEELVRMMVEEDIRSGRGRGDLT